MEEKEVVIALNRWYRHRNSTALAKIIGIKGNLLRVLFDNGYDARYKLHNFEEDFYENEVTDKLNAEIDTT